SLKGHSDDVAAVAFSADGLTLASASGNEIKLWDVVTGQEQLTLKGGANSLAFSPTSRLLVSARPEDKVVRLWRGADGQESVAPKDELDPDDPDSPLAQNDGAVRLWRTGKPAEAEKAYRGALTRLEKLAAVFPNVSGYRKELARCGFSLSLLLLTTGGSQEAAEVGRQGTEHYQKLPADYQRSLIRDYNVLGELLQAAGSHQEAVQAYSLAIELNPTDWAVWFGRAYTYGATGQHEKALADYSKVIELDPNSAVEHNDLAWVLATCPDAKFRNPGRAVELAKKAVALAPKEGNHWNTLGVAHYRAGDWKAATASLEKSDGL